MYNLDAVDNNLGYVKYLIIIILVYSVIGHRTLPLLETLILKHALLPLNIEMLNILISEPLLNALDEVYGQFLTIVV